MGRMEKVARTLKPARIQLLEEGILRHRMGIFAQFLRKYAAVRGKEKGKFLSAALLNQALAEEPKNDQAKK